MGEGARGEGAGAKRVDLGLPGPRLGPGEGEGEAFLAKGLLRTDMARWQSGLSGREKPWDSGGRFWYRWSDGHAVSQTQKKTKHDLKLCCRPAGSGSEGVARWRPAARSTKKEQTGNCRGAKTGVDRDCPAEGVRVMEQEGASSSFLLGLRVDRRAKEGGSSSRRRSLPRAKVNKSSSHKWTTADVTRGNLQILVARASSLSASAA